MVKHTKHHHLHSTNVIDKNLNQTTPPPVFDDVTSDTDLNQPIIQLFSQEHSHGFLYSIRLTEIKLMFVWKRLEIVVLKVNARIDEWRVHFGKVMPGIYVNFINSTVADIEDGRVDNVWTMFQTTN